MEIVLSSLRYVGSLIQLLQSDLCPSICDINAHKCTEDK